MTAPDGGVFDGLAAEYAWLWRAVAGRYASVRSGERASSVSLEMDDRQRDQLADLLGARRQPPASYRLDLGRLDRALGRLDPATDHVQMVERTVGLPASRPDLRDRLEARRAELARWLAGALAGCGHTAAAGWAADGAGRALASACGVEDVAAQRALAERLVTVVGALPHSPPVPLSVFAARWADGTHELDSDTNLGALTLAALAASAGVEPPLRAQQRRELWARFGVLENALKSDVLVLGAPLSDRAGAHPAGAQLAAAAGFGEPARVTLRAVSAPGLDGVWAAPPPSGGTVFVCENPAVVEVAAQEGVAGPLVCGEGTVSTATLVVLRSLASAGWTVAVGGDFEPGGLLAAGHLLREVPGAVPWRLDVVSYEGAAGQPVADGAQWRCGSTPWDRPLSEVVSARRVRVTEEDRLGRLLADVRSGWAGLAT